MDAEALNTEIDKLLDELEGMVTECQCSNCRHWANGHIGGLNTDRAREAIQRFATELTKTTV